MTAEPVLKVHQGPRVSRDRLEILTALIDSPAFAPLLRPDVIVIPQDHPVYGWGCRVTGCGRQRHDTGNLCNGHLERWDAARRSGTDRSDFIRAAEPLALITGFDAGLCRVDRCARPALRTDRNLCVRHYGRWRKDHEVHGGDRGDDAAFGRWLTDQPPYDSYDICKVNSCREQAKSALGLCQDHEERYRRAGRPGRAGLPSRWFTIYEQRGRPTPVRYEDERAFCDWCRTAGPVNRVGQLNLLGLSPLLAAEIKWGMFAHTQRKTRSSWSIPAIQRLANASRALSSFADLELDDLDAGPRLIARETIESLRIAYVTPSETREAGYIELDHFGLRFRLRRTRFDLTMVSQRWLRDLLWDYFTEQLQAPDGHRSNAPFDSMRRACTELSAFLDATAPGGGHDPEVLREEHGLRFVADLQHRASNGLPSLAPSIKTGKPIVVTEFSRHSMFGCCRRLLRWALENGDAAKLGLDRVFITAFPLGGKNPQRHRSPFSDEVAKALAHEDNLRLLAEAYDPHDRGLRDIWESIIVTGRRAGEVIKLRLNCVDRYNGFPMLWHDQTKVGNYDEAIRIPEHTYQRLQQRRLVTLSRFEDKVGRPASIEDQARIALFPSPMSNPRLENPISYHWFGELFRKWVAELDLGSCVAHQARHTLATKLLANGAGLHHIKRYLGHVSLRMAEHYANPRELHQTGAFSQVACSVRGRSGMGRRVVHAV